MSQAVWRCSECEEQVTMKDLYTFYNRDGHITIGLLCEDCWVIVYDKGEAFQDKFIKRTTVLPQTETR